jgi:predicted nicotinamide N-methyase
MQIIDKQNVTVSGPPGEDEKETWDKAAELLGHYLVRLGSHWSERFYRDPKQLGFVLSRYKFAAKMACKNARVLELGSKSGIGAPILAETAQSYTGVDRDLSAIQTAAANLKDPKFIFIQDDFLGKTYGQFEAIVGLDVIDPSQADLFFQTILKNLAPNGICVIGTPNITSPEEAVKVSRFSFEEFKKTMQRYFHQVFPFGMNDEILHTGFGGMAHYLINVGFFQKQL